MRKNRLLLSGVALAAAVSATMIIPTTTAQAATNGLSIRTLTKNVVQGDTARVKGKVIGGGAGISVTIQQRAPEAGKGWGSGRTIKTDKNGKFLLDRQIKGKFTRDYRVCVGRPGARKCSLRARIQVVPRTVGIYNQRFPQGVDADKQLTVTGSTDSALGGRIIELQQLNPANLKFYTIGTATVTPNYTFEVSGTPLIRGDKDAVFKLVSAPFVGRPQVTTSSKFTVATYAFVPLQSYTAVVGGYTAATPAQAPVQQKPGGATELFANAITPAAGANTFTVNLGGACNRFTASVFVANTAADNDAMSTNVVSAVGANETMQFGDRNIRKGDALRQVDVRIPDATSLRITQNPTPAEFAPNATGNTVPVWYANPTLSCAS